MNDSFRRWIEAWGLTTCLIAAIALRVTIIWLHADELSHDRDAYLGIARGIAAGRGYCDPDLPTPTAFRPPLYPLQLAGAMLVVPVPFAVAVVNLTWGFVAVWATWHVARLLNLRLGSVVAALLVAIDPLLLQYSSQPMTETMCTGLAALLLLAMVRLVEPTEIPSRKSTRQLFVGALFGLLVLCRPTFWPLAGLMIFVGGVSWTVAFVPTRSVRLSSVPWRIGVGVALVVGPWVLRNQLVFGTPILTTTHGGYTLLLGNNPTFYDDVVDRGVGSVWQAESFDQWQNKLQTDLRRELGPSSTELDRDRWQSHRAHKFITAEPTRFLRAAWYRVRSLWSTMPRGDVAASANSWLMSTVGWFYAAVLLSFAIGLVRVAFRPDRKLWWPLYALILTVQAVHLAYWTDARMRAPLTPAIGLFVAAAFCRQEKSTRLNQPLNANP